MSLQVIIDLLGILTLGWLIYGTVKHIQKRAREDKEHACQVKQRPTRNHAAYERCDKRNRKQDRDS